MWPTRRASAPRSASAITRRTSSISASPGCCSRWRPMRLKGACYRAARQPKQPINVHLGCGTHHYIPGWVNVDGNIVTARPDLWANLLDPLPFRKNSVQTFYSHHVVEHLPERFL